MIFPRAALAALAVIAIVGAEATATAQAPAAVQSEVRLDAITGDSWAIHAGLGVTARLGTYARYGIIGGLGGGADGTSGRTDLIVRFTLDPFRERRWAPYGVGGLSARFDGSTRAYLVVMAGMEGPMWRGVAPAIEAGFGGSFRAGVILRQAVQRRR